MEAKLIKEKVAEMINAAKGSQFVNYCNSDIPAELSLAKDNLEGETNYFKKKIFDLKVQINDQSLIGKAWISGYCQPDIFDSGWIQLHTEVLLNPEYKFDENEAFRQLKLFLDQYVLLSNYEKIIKNIEYKSVIAAGWKNLYVDLTNTKYINATFDVFDYVMQYKKLPGDAEKIHWLTYNSDALYFQRITDFKMKQFRECFQSKDGKPFKENNRLNKDPKEPLPSILKKFSDIL